MKKVKNRFFLLRQKIITLSATTFDLPTTGTGSCHYPRNHMADGFPPLFCLVLLIHMKEEMKMRRESLEHYWVTHHFNGL
jgi:hypothetical protein